MTEKEHLNQLTNSLKIAKSALNGILDSREISRNGQVFATAKAAILKISEIQTSVKVK